MATFRKLADKKRPSLERAIELSDQEVDSDVEDARPRRGLYSQEGQAASVMADAQAERFKIRKDLMKRKKRKEIAKSYGQNL